MAKFYTIYKTTNLKNGKIYIGMHETDNPEDDYLGSGKRLKRAIRYYGKKFFEKEVLFVFDNRDKMVQKEIELVNEEFISSKNTYNIMLGGKGGINSESSIEKNRQSNRKNKLGCKNPMYGRKHKPETIEKMSGKNNPMFGKKLSENQLKWTFKGRKHKPETIEKMKKSKGKQSGEKNSQFGKIWIYHLNKKTSIKIEKHNLPEYTNKGWKRGRKIKF